MELIPEIKEIMKECAHFAKTGSCYGCSDVKCVHGRYIGLILTGLAAAKEENIARAAEVEKAMFEIMGLAGKPFETSPEELMPGNLMKVQILKPSKKLKKAIKKISKDAAGKGSGAETIDFKSGKIIGTETINGLSRQEMKECIQMASGEYNSFDFKKASLQEIYAIYEKECGNGI